MEAKEKLHWSETLTVARLKARPVAQLSDQLKAMKQTMTRADAYSIQEAGVENRIKSGEKVIGYKMGLTSEAKRRQMNLDSPLYGVLTDKMSLISGSTFSLADLIHAKIEPEIAFFITRDLPVRPSREEVLKAVGGVCAALEVIDSRYEQFKYFSLEDVIADNSSSSHFVLGPWKKDFADLDLKNLTMKIQVNGKVAHQGLSSDISGDPVVSVIQLCDLLHERGIQLKKDTVVLTGAATQAVALEAGMRVRLLVDGLADASLNIEEAVHV